MIQATKTSMIQPVRTFRIFVSSTFDDLVEERNALQREVFPKLERLCRQHGTRFQAIDLRWGVREEAGLDQRTMAICLDEIDRCRDTSPRPNFIVLLGDRYGWRPLPAAIPADDFATIQERVPEGEDRDLLEDWYLRDDNAVPPEYCLKPRVVEVPDTASEEERHVAHEAERKEWRKTEADLRRILLAAVDRLSLDDDRRFKYVSSATHQEIAAGALQVNDAPQHVFSFFRSLETEDGRPLAEALPADPEPGEAEQLRKFVDLESGEPILDEQANGQLEDLKDQLATYLPGNVHRYAATWTGSAATTDHIGKLPESLAECLELVSRDADQGGDSDRAQSGAGESTTLCVDVWRRLAAVILSEIEELEEVDPLDREVDDHRRFGRDRARHFTGREASLDAIARYLDPASSGGGEARPLAVAGVSGSGKSALMGEAALRAAADHPEAIVVQRFIGATPASSDIRSLLDGVCREICRRTGADETTIPTEFRELVDDFPERLGLASADRPVFVFLDALDQLSDAENARSLVWLPAELPDHAHLVVSALRPDPDKPVERAPGQPLAALERKLPEGCLLELERMAVEEGRELLQKWLTEAHRRLQKRQMREVIGKFEACELPLYLKLAFEEARLWKSYTKPDPLSDDVEGIIRQLFARLSAEANHGPVLVAHGLGYLAAAKNGLSEDETREVLSLDQEVWDDFEARARHEPPERRLPVIVWSRLYFDLEPYLSEVGADGASLLTFYHRQLRQVAEEDYLAGDLRRLRHAQLAAYFAEEQPLYFTEGPTAERNGDAPNLRKLAELPYQQTNGELWQELFDTLTDFDFLEAKCTHVAVTSEGTGPDARTLHGGVYELQEDYRRALEVFPAE